jgi:hypothetical protein
MEKIVKHLERKSLSGSEVLDALNHSVNLIPYHMFKDPRTTLNSIMTLPNGERASAVVILYETQLNSGHYTCLLEYPDHWLFFDPYGSKKIDDELEFAEYNGGQKLYHKTLQDLLREQSKPYRVSKDKFQAEQRGINTCGRHCIVRIKMQDLSENEYKNIMQGDSDVKAVIMTMLLVDIIGNT